MLDSWSKAPVWQNGSLGGYRRVAERLQRRPAPRVELARELVGLESPQIGDCHSWRSRAGGAGRQWHGPRELSSRLGQAVARSLCEGGVPAGDYRRPIAIAKPPRALTLRESCRGRGMFTQPSVFTREPK